MKAPSLELFAYQESDLTWSQGVLEDETPRAQRYRAGLVSFRIIFRGVFGATWGMGHATRGCG